MKKKPVLTFNSTPDHPSRQGNDHDGLARNVIKKVL
jgi:hypothetical protein